MNILTKNSEIVRMIWDRYINENSVVIDATCGNGNDTIYLALRAKKVYAFDIQKEAIDNTDKLLKEHDIENVVLICDSHEKINEYVSENVDLAVYNLGYLPKGNKEITTNAESTLISFEKVLTKLSVSGLICLTLYWGHPEGKLEKEAVLNYVSLLDSSIYHVAYMSFPNQKNTPPEILLITKKK
jgi:hypothetical protein